MAIPLGSQKQDIYLTGGCDAPGFSLNSYLKPTQTKGSYYPCMAARSQCLYIVQIQSCRIYIFIWSKNIINCLHAVRWKFYHKLISYVYDVKPLISCKKNDKNLQNWLLKQYTTQWIFNKAVETPQEMREFLVFNISKSRTQQFIGNYWLVQTLYQNR